MEKKLTNSGPLMEPADKHSICTIKLIARGKLDVPLHGAVLPTLPRHLHTISLQEYSLKALGRTHPLSQKNFCPQNRLIWLHIKP
jgi:hypothetical protein